jgi:hypothetical protein
MLIFLESLLNCYVGEVGCDVWWVRGASCGCSKVLACHIDWRYLHFFTELISTPLLALLHSCYVSTDVTYVTQEKCVQLGRAVGLCGMRLAVKSRLRWMHHWFGLVVAAFSRDGGTLIAGGLRCHSRGSTV